MKKTKSQHTVEIEAQVPAGVVVTFREDLSRNPSKVIVLRADSPQNLQQAEATLQSLLSALQAELA